MDHKNVCTGITFDRLNQLDNSFLCLLLLGQDLYRKNERRRSYIFLRRLVIPALLCGKLKRAY